MRASRLLAILILLQNRGRLTAESLAAEFEVSERTIYRDIDALSAAGVPVYGDRGPGGGFALLDGYRTRLTGLAADEATALAFAGVPSAAQAIGFGSALRDAFGKLLLALPGEGREQAGKAAGTFLVDPADWYRGGAPSPHLPELARATLAQRQIEIRYASWQNVREHRLDPLGLVLKGGQWYLVGHGHKGLGTYRVEAIRHLQVLDHGFERPTGFVLADWWRKAQAAFEASLFSSRASLRVSPLGLERLAALSPRGAEAASQAQVGADGWFRTNMAVEDSDHGARELLGLGAELEVLGPPGLRARMAQLAQGIAAHYVSTSGDGLFT